jgi:hypothetical protein
MPDPIRDDGRVDPGAAFSRLVLGEPAPVTSSAEPDPVAAVAAAWRTCVPELERRRGALAWEDAEPATPSAALAGLPDLERGAVAAQAVGLGPQELEAALDTEVGAAPGLLARGHAALAGLGLPAGETCARERERLAVAPRPSSGHCAACREFAAAVGPGRAALVLAARGPRGPRVDPARAGARAVTVVVVLAAAAAGFGVVSAFERDAAGGDPAS